MNFEASLIGSNQMKLFHISKEGIVGNITPCSRSNCDFGSGFYMGDEESDIFSFLDSKKFANRKFYDVSLNFNGLNIYHLTFCKWLIYVLYNRGFLSEYGIENCALIDSMMEFYDSYDLIIGAIADDSIYEAMDLFADGLVSDTFVYRVFTEIRLCKQIVAISVKACSNLKVTEVFPSDYDRRMFDNIRAARIIDSKKVLQKVPSEYRRTGRFISDYVTNKFMNMQFMELPDTWVEMSKGDWL